MRILGLRTENVRRVKLVEFEPGPGLTIVGGNNGHGKSSTLDSIVMAMGGEGAMGFKPLREGAELGSVRLKLGDEDVEFEVERTFKQAADGGRPTTSLTVRDKDGNRFTGPQTILNGLFGSFTFDPLAFASMKPREQVDELKAILGVADAIDALDRAKGEAYAERTEVGREVKRLDALLSKAENFPDAPDEEIDVADLLSQLKAAQQLEADIEGAAATLRKLDGDIVRLDEQAEAATEASIDEIASADAELKAAKERHAERHAAAKNKLMDTLRLIDAEKFSLDETMTRAHERAAELADFAKAAPKAADLETSIQMADATNRKVRSNAERAQTALALKAAEAKRAALSEKIAETEAAKAAAIQAADCPIDGLGFDENGVTYKGQPFEQASDAERLTVSMAIASAANPKLRLAIMKNGSLLDPASLAAVEKYAAENDLQILMERVGKLDAGAVIIEDGGVEKL